jgi:tRNA pseudouridine38-40 synthase
LTVNDETLYVAGLVAYDGTDFHGYQFQLGVRTVQGELESALSKFCEPVGRVSAAGRTDTGVHANGQVVAASVKWRHDVEQLQNAWNAHLPDSVCVRRLQIAPDGFHPRFSAQRRTYRYRIVQSCRDSGTSARRSPLTDRYAWYVGHPLNLASIQDAAARLVGENDFATFGQPTQGESTIRNVYQAEWQFVESSLVDLDEYPGQRLAFTITANGFLRQMVRTITGTLVEVGLGKREPDCIEELLAAKDRSLSAPPAPASGLTLENVAYPDEYSFINAST